MDIDFSDNIREVERGLSDFARREVPFATSKAINAVALAAREESGDVMRRSLDRPTRFTQRAFAVRRSSKRNLTASVFAKDRQAAYLTFAESGGTRRPKRTAIRVPSKARRNRYGNMSRKATDRAYATGRAFSGVPRGGGRPGGIYLRSQNSKRLSLLVTYARSLRYSPSMMMRKALNDLIHAELPRHFERELAAAIRDSRAKGRMGPT